MLAEPSVAVLRSLLAVGWARVPETWSLDGPAHAGLWWRAGSLVVATPALVRLAAALGVESEVIGAILATEPRYREAWLDQIAARLAQLGARKAIPELFASIDQLGFAAESVRPRLGEAQLATTTFTAVEIQTFGAPADQPAALPALLRVVGVTASLVEGGQANLASPLPIVHAADPATNWIAGRLLQFPGALVESDNEFILSGRLASIGNTRMLDVLRSPWFTLLAVLVFTAEAWAAERHGGVVLELPVAHLAEFAAPPRVDVVVTLDDGREVLCGTLGELCLRVLDSLGMSVIPPAPPARIDGALSSFIAALLRSQVWTWQAIARPRYVIADAFGFECYGREGVQFMHHGAEDLSQAIRGVCVAWARTHLERAA